jgi:uncharacterized protein YegJ (DUF2314 family)
MGVVSDTPRETKLVKLGDNPVINDDDVVDWLYGKDSVLHGGYTIRLIYSRLPSEELEKERSSFPYKIEGLADERDRSRILDLLEDFGNQLMLMMPWFNQKAI